VLQARPRDLDPVRELPYRPAAHHRCTRGRTDGSIRLRATTILKFSLAWSGASTDGTGEAGYRTSRPSRTYARPRRGLGKFPEDAVRGELEVMAWRNGLKID
jgi:hypothetical protein